MRQFLFNILILSVVSTSYADSTYIPTFKGSFPLGAQCVMHFKTTELLATIVIEATGQKFNIEKVITAQKFREVTNGTYHGSGAAVRCAKHRNQHAMKKGYPI